MEENKTEEKTYEYEWDRVMAELNRDSWKLDETQCLERVAATLPLLIPEIFGGATVADGSVSVGEKYGELTFEIDPKKNFHIQDYAEFVSEMPVYVLAQYYDKYPRTYPNNCHNVAFVEAEGAAMFWLHAKAGDDGAVRRIDMRLFFSIDDMVYGLLDERKRIVAEYGERVEFALNELQVWAAFGLDPQRSDDPSGMFQGIPVKWDDHVDDDITVPTEEDLRTGGIIQF